MEGRDLHGNPPRISVVVPSYNQGKFIEKTIRSIILQNYPDLEIIVVDGGSTDGSVETIRKYADWISFWVSEKDRGQSDAINKGLARATGEIFCWLNTDDFFLPGALFTVAAAYQLNENPDVQVWVGAADKVDENGNLIYAINPDDLTRESFYHWRNPQKPAGKGNFLQPSCFFTRRAWEVAGPLNLELQYSMDVHLWLKMAERFRFSAIPEKLAVAVGHSQAKTTKDVERTVAEVALVIAEHGGRQVAQVDLMRMVDDYVRIKDEWNRLRALLPVKIIRKLKSLLGS